MYKVYGSSSITIMSYFNHYSAAVPNIPTEEWENGNNAGNEKSIPRDPCKLEHKVKFFPKLFVMVIYIVIMFVSFGTVLTHLSLLLKGKQDIYLQTNNEA